MKPLVFAVASAAALESLAPHALAQESKLAALSAATKATPSDPAAELALGHALRLAGRSTQALGELRRGVALSWSKPELLPELDWEVARTFIDRRDFIQATIECKVLGKLPGKTADGLACEAGAHLVWLRSTEALAGAAQALAKDPRSYEATLVEARAYDYALDDGKSEEAFRAAIALRPDAIGAHLGLGRLLARLKRVDPAVTELRRALQIDPSDPDALYALAIALPPGPESVALLDSATRERPSAAEAWLALGGQELARGRVADAKRAAEAALHADPTAVGSHLLLGRVALAEGRADDAIHAGEAALKLVANSAAARLLIADGDAKKGDIDLALEAYQAAWGLDHDDPTPLVHAAEACNASGRPTSARAFGLKAAQEFPKWGPAWAALGDALASQGEKDGAADAYRKALAAEGPVDRDAVTRKLGALR